MPTNIGDKTKGRFYVKNISKDFVIPYNEFEIEQVTSRLVDKFDLTTGRNSNNQVGDEIAVFDRSANDKKRFGGYITGKDETDGAWEIEADEYVREVVDASVKEVYRDMSPEAILEDLINNYTSLTFFAPQSSGFTMDKYVIEGKIEQAIKDMTDLLDWQARSTPQREFYFEPRGRLKSSKSYTHGDNCVVTKKTTKDSDYINTVELRAGRTNYTRSNSFTGDGSTIEFTLTEVPVGSVNVTVDGVDQEGAIAEDLQSGDDFFIDVDGPTLIFSSAPSNGATIDISYTYEVPILVEAEAQNAQIPASDREISTTIKRKWIKTFSDAREYAKAYANNHATLVGEVKLMAPFTEEPPIGYVVNIEDTNKDIDNGFVVERKTLDQDGMVRIKAGDQDFNAIEWRNAVQRRIKEIEKSQTTNKTLTKYQIFDSNIDISFSSGVIIKKREINDSFILGSQLTGVLGEDKLGDRRGAMIWGNTDTSVWGDSVWGGSTGNKVTIVDTT